MKISHRGPKRMKIKNVRKTRATKFYLKKRRDKRVRDKRK